MIVETLIENYIKNSIQLHNELDFTIKRKCIEKADKIIKKVISNNFQNEFFSKLFESKEPFVLADIASDSLAMKYDVKKSFEIMKYLKDNSHKLTFSNDEIINKEAQNFYMRNDLMKYENELKLYELIDNDFIYHKFHEYWELIINHYNWYIKNTFSKKSIKPWNDEIDDLLISVEKNGKLINFFKLTCDMFNNDDCHIPMTINAFYLWKYTGRKEEALSIIKGVLSGSDSCVTPQLRKFANE